MVHTCWVLNGVAWLSPGDFVKAKQDSVYMHFQYMYLSVDEMVRASGGKTDS